MDDVTFSCLQIGNTTFNGVPDLEPQLNPPKIWDEVYRTKLKHNYQTKTTPWTNMFRMVQSGYRAISGALTVNGTMNEDSFISMQMILLDFDEGYRLEEMRGRFSKYRNLIHTSRNHLKDKSKKGIAERFRVILPLERPHTNKADLKQAMKFLVDDLYANYGIDKACKDLTRIMFAGGIDCLYFYNDGDFYPMDETIFLAKESAQKKVYIPKERVYPTGSTKADWYRQNLSNPMLVDKLNLIDRVASGRNSALHNAGLFLLKDVGLNPDEVTDGVLYLNSQLSDPLDEREIQSTIFRSLRIGGAR